MSPLRSKVLDYAVTGTKLLEKISDMPVLNALKPIVGLAALICENAATMEENRTLGAKLSERVQDLVFALVESTSSVSENALPSGAARDIQKLEGELKEIQRNIAKLGRPSRMLGLDNLILSTVIKGKIARLEADMHLAIAMYGVKSHKQLQETTTVIKREVAETLIQVRAMRTELTDAEGRVVHTDYLEVKSTILDTNVSTLQQGVYEGRLKLEPVVVKRFKPGNEQDLLEELEQRRRITHPNIPQVYGHNKDLGLMLLRAGEMLFNENLLKGGVYMPDSLLISSMECFIPHYNAKQPDKPFNRGTAGPHWNAYLCCIVQLWDVEVHMRRAGLRVDWKQFEPSWLDLKPSGQMRLLDGVQVEGKLLPSADIGEDWKSCFDAVASVTSFKLPEKPFWKQCECTDGDGQCGNPWIRNKFVEEWPEY